LPHSNDNPDQDRLAAQRLTGLLDYVEALVKLDERVATRLSQHKLADGSQFILHQHELVGLPGLKCDFADDDGPIWLRIQRLARSAPPAVAAELDEWIDVSNDPTCAPEIREIVHCRVPEVERQRLVEEGHARAEDCARSLKAGKSDPPNVVFYDVMLRLEDRPDTRAALDAYCAGAWAEWSEQEKPRRRSIAIYQRLFEIAQRLLQSGGSESIELIWGIGLSRWNSASELIDLPMIESGVEIEIAETGSAEISVRPRHGINRVELRPFEKLAGPRFSLAEDAARRCVKSLQTPDSEGISPFRQETFEPILKICGNQLDPEGRYLPEHRSLASGEPVPDAEGKSLTVSDRYVIFARRRSANSILRDIDQLKATVNSEEKVTKIEGSARTLVLGPSDGLDDTFRPLGDHLGDAGGISVGVHEEPSDSDHGDLFFPKPFNDEQVEIIRRLEKSDGLVVQGPPGTGKTHTIANIVSHMLATGRRVLVVSHGETALRVIQDQLPDGVRDLAISVTTSEREGLKQVEKAAGLMLSIVNAIDMNRGRQIKVIQDLETDITANKKRLTHIDEQLAALATPHLSNVPGSKLTPYEAAESLVKARENYDWFVDRPERFLGDAKISHGDVDALLAARKTAKDWLKYLDAHLPSPANLPDPETLRGWHRDLVVAQKLTEESEDLEPLTRRSIANVGLEAAEKLANTLRGFASNMEKLQRQVWAWELSESLSGVPDIEQRLGPLIRVFLTDAQDLLARRSLFLSRPVELPNNLPPEKQLTQILEALIAGKNPFGMFSFSTKTHQALFETVRVGGAKPSASQDWQHVRLFVGFCAEVDSLSARWEALRPELSAPAVFSFGSSSPLPLVHLVDALSAALISLPAEFNVLSRQLSSALGSDTEAEAILHDPTSISAFSEALLKHVSSVRLSAVRRNIAEAAALFDESESDIAGYAKQILTEIVGKSDRNTEQLTAVWQKLRAQLGNIRSLEPLYDRIKTTTRELELAGAPIWASRLRSEFALEDGDPAAPANWSEAWEWAVQLNYLEKIGATSDLKRLHQERLDTERSLRDGFAALVKERTFYNLAATMKGSAKSALQGFANTIRRLGAGTGQRAVLHKQNAREAMQGCYDAVPCWIMPTWRVSEQLPAVLGSFDLVILDEASQSDARELPALLRGKKILVVGDDRQVSPSSAFLSIASIARLRHNFLSEFPFRAEVEPGASLYDLARVMFPAKFVMLKEHFRCVEPIIRFSMQFYNENLIPLRVPKPTERLDPPLIDIFVEDGERRGKSKVNLPEAEIIVSEIEKIVEGTAADGTAQSARSIGIISLIGAEQALHIQKMLMERIGEAAMVRHRVVCGDSAMLQGDERDIVFLSMIADSSRKQAQTALQYQQRFNVALSRARDRMFLVRSVREEQLNPNDLKARVIAHFRDPMPRSEGPTAALIDLCQSEFEKVVFRSLVQLGYHVTPQVGSVGFSIDMVVEGEGGRRLAIECDGDRYHGPERWADDMRRQRILERVGWTFWRCFGSNYSLDPEGVFADLLATLDRMKIMPIEREAAGRGFSEHFSRKAKSADEPNATSGDNVSPFEGHAEQEGEVQSSLQEGDRVVIRYLDIEPSRPEFFVLSTTLDDRINGYLLLTSPLGLALAGGSPGDELTVLEDGRERAFLFVSLETAAAKAA
jgi:transcription elongation GreA/GreB family factor/very-short-patch-repair endonuclease